MNPTLPRLQVDALCSLAGYRGSPGFFPDSYLLSHGVIKVGLVWALWQRRLWAYPAAIMFFLFFIGYQLYRYTYAPSAGLIVLTMVDLAVVWVTWLEYKRLQATG